MNENIVITISREYGSGGLGIGEKLAETLHIPFYSNDSISKLAEQEPFLTETNCEWLMDNNLRPTSLIGSAFSFGYAYGEINSQEFVKESNVIWKLAKAGPCVIVGRCADFVLRDRPHTYRLYISSRMIHRLRQIRMNPSQYDAALKKEAKDIIQMDKKRAAYYNHYTGQIWGKASNYDMCIDTGKLGSRTVDIIEEFIRRSEELSSKLTEQ